MRARLVGILALVISMIGVAAVAEAAQPQQAVATTKATPEGNPDLTKVSSHLLRARQLAAADTSAADIAAATPLVRYEAGVPLIELRFDELTDSTIDAVEALGFRTTGAFPKYATMVGYAPLDLLDELAAVPGVAVINPEYGAVTAVGSVTSQADVSINADDARSEFGVDGSGISVGVLSDTFNSGRGGTVSGSGCATTVTGMDDQTSGDLPASVVLLQDTTGTDEGAGMAELVYDLAPGVDLMFNTAFVGGQAGFASGIDALVACGADVIVDDVIYFTEPMFQDGPVAQAAQNAVDAGIPFFSSAGNQGTFGVSETYVDYNPGSDDTLVTPSGDDFHDFGSGNRFASVTLDPGEGVRFVLQWNQPFDGALGAGSANDLDLYLFDAPSPAGTVVANSVDVQGTATCTGAPANDPSESIAYQNFTGSSQTLYLAVEHYCGSEDVDFRIAAYGNGNSITSLDFDTGIFTDPQIYGHAAAEGVGATAAVYFEEIDAGGGYTGGPEVNVEAFSSSGGQLPFYFGPTGDPLSGAPVMRYKPEIASPDGTNTSFFGSDTGDPDAFPNFFGTSAAAPHAAAVAALMLEEKPGLTPAQLMAALRTSAIDIESAGQDALSGDGLIDARDAVAAAGTVDTEAPTWPGGSAVTFSNVTETSARASWNAATDNVGVAGYRVYVDGSIVGFTTDLFYDLGSLAVGTSYTVSVEAVDAVGNESTTGPSATLLTADNTPPVWPGGSAVAISDITTSSATASWNAATDNAIDAAFIAGYKVYLNGVSLGTTTSTSVSITNLIYATSYTVKVEAVDGAGNESTTGPSASFTTVNPLPPGGSFIDDDGNIHEGNIEAIAAVGVTKGCNPPTNNMYCPGSSVTRGQMAAFLVRALGLTDDGGGNSFVDDDGSVFEVDIAKLAAAGITKGCNPPTNNMFCPNDPVTRGQMAAFLVRALGLTDDGGGNSFIDDDGSIFEVDIAKLAAAGITKGCNPPTNNMFCPNDPVKRDQMASFIARALGLSPISPP